jgi:hypothetical protein
MIRRLLSREEVEIGKNVNSVHNVEIAQLQAKIIGNRSTESREKRFKRMFR